VPTGEGRALGGPRPAATAATALSRADDIFGIHNALREYAAFSNRRRPHQGIANARPLRPLPESITDADRLSRLDIRRRDRLGGILHEYEHAA